MKPLTWYNDLRDKLREKRKKERKNKLRKKEIKKKNVKKKPLAKNEVKRQSKTVENIILRTLKAYIYFYRFLASALGVWEWQKNHLELGRVQSVKSLP